jgi:oligopeptide/dipeptide ABC transporter ATP-binding protein
MTGTTVPLVEARGLHKQFVLGRDFFGRPQSILHAVDGVDLAIQPGETLGLVGESGCGKSTLGRLLLRLIEPTSGSIRFDGDELVGMSARDLRSRRAEFQIIFQDPFSCLNPRMTVEQIVADPLRVHDVPVSERKRRVRDLLDLVGLPSHMAGRFPHEFSGGQRQRIGIARALALKPRFIVCDEPLSALDVSIQAQIINLMIDLQNELGLTCLFIGHDLSVIRLVSARVAVMYLGKIVEIGPGEQVLSRPSHPYTQALLSAIPATHPRLVRQRKPLAGDIPSPLRPPSGCRFHPRCPKAQPLCSREAPPLRALPGDDGRDTACHFAETGA